MKKIFLVILTIFINLFLFAQTQYDYYDDGAVAGGADRALNGIIIIGGLVIIVLVLAFLLGGAAKIYYWFNPEADPEYKREMAAKKREAERAKEQTIQNNPHCVVNIDNSTKEEKESKQEISDQKIPIQQKEEPKHVKNIEIDGFTLSPDGTKLIKGSDTVECHIPYGVKVVCDRAFNDAHQIKNLYIPETVEEVEEFAFSCDSTETVYIPKSISKWGENAFFGCYKLREVIIDPETCTWGYGMFSLCTSMECIIIPPKMKGIPSHSFDGCRSLRSVTLPEHIEQIGDGAFLGCENLEHIELPNSINRIGNGAFQECQRLESISLPTSLVGLSDYLFMNCFCLKELIIPEGVVAIGESCFNNCCELRNVQLPSSLLYIGNNAFEDCYNLIIKAPYNTELDEFYSNNHSLGNDCEIIRYDAPSCEKTEHDKKKLEKFIKHGRPLSLQTVRHLLLLYFQSVRGRCLRETARLFHAFP